jgi:hypothetical protein
MYNPTYIIPGSCFLNCYPATCLRDDSIECERGENYFVWLAINTGVLFISLLVGLFSLVLTCRSVKRTQIRQSRWTVSSSFDFLPNGVENTDPRSSQAPNGSLRRGLSMSTLWSSSFRLSGIYNAANNNNSILAETTRQVAIQTALYIGSYVLVLIPYFVLVLSRLALDITKENRQFYFFWVFLVKLSISSSGIWNFLIYCRPRLRSLRKQNPDCTRVKLLRHIVLHSKHETEARPVRRLNAPLQRPSPVSETAQEEASTRVTNDENLEREFTPELDLHYLKCESESLNSNHDVSGSYEPVAASIVPAKISQATEP